MRWLKKTSQENWSPPAQNSSNITNAMLLFIAENKRNEGVSSTLQGRKKKTMVNKIHPHPSKHAPGQTVYERYLRTEELLSLQKSENALVHHDELQFQVVHHVPLGFSRVPQGPRRRSRHRLTPIPRLDDPLSPALRRLFQAP